MLIITFNPVWLLRLFFQATSSFEEKDSLNPGGWEKGRQLGPLRREDINKVGEQVW